jgi:RimJ/RimL family protein N-acetyltransferase
MSDPSPLDVLRAVLDPVRLAVLGDAVRGPVSIRDIATRMDVTPRDVAEAVGQLRSVGLIDRDGSLDTHALRAVAKSLPQEHEQLGRPVAGPWTDEEAAILGRFFDGDTLVQIPQAHAKRRLVLEKVALRFEPGRRYAERDVNFSIQLIHPDYAAVRRYLVEEGFMDRADGAYWRTGGRYEPPAVVGHVVAGDGTLTTAIDGMVLVPYRPAMVTALAAAANDPRINRFMGDEFPYPYSEDDARRWIEMAMEADPPTQYAVVLDGALVGGLGGFAGSGEMAGTTEIGWWLNPEHWGRGITTAAVIALVDEFFSNRDVMRVWAPVMAPNIASRRVAEKVGLRPEGVSPSAYVKNGVRHDQVHFGLTRAQWLSDR